MKGATPTSCGCSLNRLLIGHFRILLFLWPFQSSKFADIADVTCNLARVHLMASSLRFWDLGSRHKIWYCYSPHFSPALCRASTKRSITA